jgi:hypothetical protein
MFCFFWTSYKATFLNRSDNTWRHLRLHILSPFPPSSALPVTYFPCQMTAQTCQPTQSRTRLRRQRACSHETVFWKILHVSSSLPDCVCVFTAAWLHILDISFFAIHVGPSSVTFSTRIGVSAHSRVCAQPPRGYIFQTFPSSLLQHIPSHTSVLSPTPTFAHACTVTIMKFLFLISENNAVHQVSRLVIPGSAGYPG